MSGSTGCPLIFMLLVDGNQSSDILYIYVTADTMIRDVVHVKLTCLIKCSAAEL